jgi:hypothetical protein
MEKRLKSALRLPRSRLARQVLGWALVVGGLLGWLPVLGFWMLPLGLYVLSADSARIRRLRRRLTARIGRSPTIVRARSAMRRWWGRRQRP